MKKVVLLEMGEPIVTQAPDPGGRPLDPAHVGVEFVLKRVRKTDNLSDRRPGLLSTQRVDNSLDPEKSRQSGSCGKRGHLNQRPLPAIGLGR